MITLDKDNRAKIINKKPLLNSSAIFGKSFVIDDIKIKPKTKSCTIKLIGNKLDEDDLTKLTKELLDKIPKVELMIINIKEPATIGDLLSGGVEFLNQFCGINNDNGFDSIIKNIVFNE